MQTEWLFIQYLLACGMHVWQKMANQTARKAAVCVIL